MYYNVLNTENITFPPKLSVNNHISCCLFYLAKDNKDYTFTVIGPDGFSKDVKVHGDGYETLKDLK